MKPVALLITIVIGGLLVGNLAAQEAAHTVAGEVRFSESGDVYVALLTEETFGRRREPAYLQILTPQPDSNVVAFQFESIPTGRYALRAFQDVNGDGTPNVGPRGPREPFGMHRRPERMRVPPRFDESAFDVAGDVADIQLELQ